MPGLAAVQPLTARSLKDIELLGPEDILIIESSFHDYKAGLGNTFGTASGEAFATGQQIRDAVNANSVGVAIFSGCSGRSNFGPGEITTLVQGTSTKVACYWEPIPGHAGKIYNPASARAVKVLAKLILEGATVAAAVTAANRTYADRIRKLNEGIQARAGKRGLKVQARLTCVCNPRPKSVRNCANYVFKKVRR